MPMEIFNHTVIVEQQLAITAGAYSANDVVGGLLTFDVHSAGGGGVIRQVILCDDDGEAAACKLYFFNAAPSSIADNGAYAPTFADLKKRVGARVAIAAADYNTFSGNSIAVKSDLSIEYATDGGKLYAYLVCDATPTYSATTDLYLRLVIWED